MRLMNWNIEWMNDWFVPIREGDPAWRTENPGRRIADVRALADRVAGVIRALRPDAVTIQEGPSRLGEMELFVRDHLDDGYTILGPAGFGAQKLYTLVRKGGAVEAAERVWPEPGQVDFEEDWPVDVTGDLIVEGYGFTRPPLVVRLTVAGRAVTVVNIHSKSKYIHGGRSLWDNEATRPQFVAQAVRNRRRIAAELMRVRHFLDEAMDADAEDRLIVAGDLNDGPGRDYFEELYLIQDVVAVVSGSPFRPQRMLRHAFVDRMLKAENWTARFDDFIDNVRDRPLLLDHILVSPSVYWGGLRASTIEHGAFDAACVPGGSGREARPSDHRPQTATLEFG